MTNNAQQSGAALISALFITALTAIIATALMMSQRLLIHQAALVTNTDQMYLDLQGVQDWAEAIIIKNADLQKIKPLHKNFYGTHISGHIYPQGGLFNINCLLQTENQPRFIHLLRGVIPNITTRQAGNIATAVSEWLLPSQADDYYVRQHPPYRAPHRLMVNISELRAVRGITAPMYAALKPYITALPSQQYHVDVNYAPIPVLLTLSDKMNLAQAQLLYACRKEHGLFNSTTDYIKLCSMNTPLDVGNITVDEKYYIVRGSAKRSTQQLSLTSLLLKYADSNNHTAARIAWQELGG